MSVPKRYYVVLASDYDALRAEVERLTKERDKFEKFWKDCITDLCDFEKEMEAQHGIEFADDYGGVTRFSVGRPGGSWTVSISTSKPVSCQVVTQRNHGTHKIVG